MIVERSGEPDVHRAVEQITVQLAEVVESQLPLAPFTTYRVGGPAAAGIRVRSLADLRVLAEAMGSTDVEVPVLVVGRGSNLLVADSGFSGIALIIEELDGVSNTVHIVGTTVVAGASVALPVLARQTAAASLTGLEWAVGVPGSVGGAVRMNAGGHGSDIATSLVSVRVFDLRTGNDEEVSPEVLGLRFRGSRLTDDHVVLAATFELAQGDRSRSEAEITEIVRWRREHQPGGHNAGSVFVNPVPGLVAAAQLVDDLGLRGYRRGTAHVSEKHANFIQADEGGSADDVRAVIDHVRSCVDAHHGIMLRSEIRMVGFEEVTGRG